MGGNEILVVPKNGQGHLIPSMELCKHLLSRNFQVTVLVDADISSSVPASLRASPLFSLAVLPPPPSSRALHAFLSDRRPPRSRPACAVIDHVRSREQQAFAEFGIPTVVFITAGAAWAAVQHAVWKVRPADMKPGETRPLPGLPADVVLSYSDLHQRLHWLPPSMRTRRPSHGAQPPTRRMGPPLPGEPAPWVEDVSASTAIVVNTCDFLERPFLDYVADLTRKPVFAVGPLLPDQYWLSPESLRSDREIRPKRDSNYTDDEVLRWLDAKPRGSVTYVSFGSEVGPSAEEYPLLADALEGSARPFIWVIQRKKKKEGEEEEYFPDGLSGAVGERGLIIHGWAPQLLILSHQATAGFVSHCGWNSTVEAVARGVPLLAWPIRGDQYYNAKLVVSFLKVGTLVAEGYPAEMVKKEDIVQGIERLATDEGIRTRAAALQAKFHCGFPATSVASLDAFRDFFWPKQEGGGGCSS